MQLYVNGSRADTTVYDVNSTSAIVTAPVRLGTHDYNGVWGYLHGLIDEVRIYDRALTEAEIQALANELADTEPTTLAWWMFEETGSSVIDNSGNGNNGTTVGTTSIAGRFGNARSFNGVDDHIAVPDSASLSFGASDPFTITAWVYPLKVSGTAPDGRTYYAVIGTNWGAELGIVLAFENDKVLFVANGRWGAATFVYSTASVTEGRWYHLAGVRDTAGRKLQIYIDGQLDAELNNIPLDPLDTTYQWGIGAFTAGTPWVGHLLGTIDEVRIYNKALSAAEIQALASQ